MSTPDPTTLNQTTPSHPASSHEGPRNSSVPPPHDNLSPTAQDTTLPTVVTPAATPPAPMPTSQPAQPHHPERPRPPTADNNRKGKGKGKATVSTVEIVSKRNHYVSLQHYEAYSYPPITISQATNPFLRIRPTKADEREKRPATQRGLGLKKPVGMSTSEDTTGAFRQAIVSSHPVVMYRRTHPESQDPQLYQGAINRGFAQQHNAPPVTHQQAYSGPPPPEGYYASFPPTGYNVPPQYQAPIQQQHPYQAFIPQQGYHGPPNGWIPMPGNMPHPPHLQPPHATQPAPAQYPVQPHYAHPQQSSPYGPNAQVQQGSFQISTDSHPSSRGHALAREQSSETQDEVCICRSTISSAV